MGMQHFTKFLQHPLDMRGSRSKVGLLCNDFAILRALAMQVRVLSRDQIVRGWFSTRPDGDLQAKDAIERLQSEDLVCSQRFEVHPLLPLSQPLFAWSPKSKTPTNAQIRDLAEAFQSRWTAALVPIELFLATKRAYHLFGSFVDARHLKLCEATHDYHLGEVFVRYLSTVSGSNVTWWGEAAFPKMGLELKGVKDPDAFILNEKGEALRVVEFAGSYDEEHLNKFHMHCAGDGAKKIAKFCHDMPNSSLLRLYNPRGTSYELR